MQFFQEEDGSKRFSPGALDLKSDGHHLLMTDAGPLDLLGVVGEGETYESLLARTVEMSAGEMLKVQVLELATLIELKEHAGREKDLAVLPVLRATALEKLQK